MKLGMMQPYFYPYLGYWQLMNAVDEYIIYDDVNFIKGGWVNRNRIKINGSAAFFGLQLKKASQNKRINELELAMTDTDKEKLLLKMKTAYGKAPYADEVLELFKVTLFCDRTNLAEFLAYSNRKIAEYMGIKTPILSATEMKLDHTNKGWQRMVDICHERRVSTYINSIGGKELYDKRTFMEAGIELQFLRMDPDIVYPQEKGEFIPSLSILDVLMYNSKEEVQKLLKRYTIE